MSKPRAGRIEVLFELLRDHLSLVPANLRPTPEDERLFRAACLERCARVARLIATVTAVGTVLWWPTDVLVYGPVDRGIRGAAIGRAAMLVSSLLTLLLLRIPRLGRHAMAIFAAGLLPCCAVMAYSAGLMGGLDAPWFHLLYIAVYIPVLIPLPPAQRLALTVGIDAALSLGLLLPFPENLRSVYLPLNISMQIALLPVGTAFGHVLYVLNRHSFYQARVIERDAEALRDHSAGLEQRVEERTTELRQLLSRVEGAREEERTRVSRELHDELGQEMAVLGYAAGALQRRYEKDPLELSTEIEDLTMQLEHARRTLRALVTDLRPRVLDDLGLCAALEWLTARTQDRGEVPCSLRISGERVPVPGPVAVAAFRVVQESLTNALRHAQARSIQVEVAIAEGRLGISVRDDGKGASPEALSRPGGVGLLGMRERARACAGDLQIETAERAGTTVRCRLAWEAARPSPPS